MDRIDRHSVGVSQEALQKAQEAIGVEPWPSRAEIFPDEALTLRGRDYI